MITAQEGDALLMLGIQTDTAPGNEQIIAALNPLLDLYQTRGLPIYAVRFSEADFPATLGLPAFAKLMSLNRSGSAFNDTPLAFQIRMYGTKRVFIAGIPADSVPDSVRDAQAAGFEVTVLSDAVPAALLPQLLAPGVAQAKCVDIV